MIEILVVLLVLGAATVVFYPALAGTGSARSASKASGGATPMDEDAAEQLALLVETRNRLLRNLAELDSERAAGRLGESDYADLKRRDEIAAAKAIHDLEAFQAEQKAGQKKGRGGKQPAPAPARRRLGPVLGWVGGTAAFAAILGITMARSVAPRAEGGTITGTMPGGGNPEAGAPSPIGSKTDPVRLAKLEKEIKKDSSSLKNLLEAGHLYLAERRLDEAAQVTIKALSLDSESPEGLAHIGMLLFAEGSSQQDHPDSAQHAFDAAIDALNRAARAKPDLAEAWLFKGMVMMAGKRDPKSAAQAWEQYLKVAPADADTTRIHAMVEAAKQAGGR